MIALRPGLLCLCLASLAVTGAEPRGERTIGPLHIPPPPSLVKEGGEEARKVWFARLSRAQQRYVTNYCNSERNAYSELCGGTPLVASFDVRPIDFSSGRPSARTPWLALDVNRDGKIDAAMELFGSETVLPDGRVARDGFEALAALDSNHDGVIDARDADFSRLLLWADRDGDQASSPAELTPLSQVIEAISLTTVDRRRCDRAQNCERQRAAMSWRSPDGAIREGEVVDVFLHHPALEVAIR